MNRVGRPPFVSTRLRPALTVLTDLQRQQISPLQSKRYQFSSPEKDEERARVIPKLLLFTGPCCQLCEVAKVVLADVKKEVPFHIDFYNIKDDSLPNVSHYRRAYQYDIPVLHMNGKEIGRHRFNKDVLVKVIREASNSSDEQR